MSESLAHVYRSGRRGLAGVDLRIVPGESVALLGPNGSGKSTLVRILAGLFPPSSGAVRVLDRDPATADAGFRRRLAVALDRPAHWEALGGRENAVLLARARGLGREAARDRVDALLDRLGLEGEADVPVAEYSLGMRKRLQLVETLCGDPELILLDEPTLGLDPEGVAALAGLLAERTRSGAALLLATNDVASAPALAGRVVLLLDGEVIADAGTDALLRSVGGRTRFEMTVEPRGPEVLEVLRRSPLPAGVRIEAEGERLVADSDRGGEPLPGLVAALLHVGATLRSLNVREPDLGDVFRELTGRSLTPGGEPASGDGEPRS